MRDAYRVRRGKMAALVSLVLLAGLAAETRFRPHPAEAEPYHARVRALASNAPLEFEGWVGMDQRAPSSAIQLLKPNVILSRVYVHSRTRASVQVLLVHCKDARDIYGHYPPICYPSHGMNKRSVQNADWTVGGLEIEGKEYEFDASRLGEGGILVDNFLIVPGRYARDMEAVGDLAGDYTRRFYGAAQIQVVFQDPQMWTEAQRRETFETMVRAYAPIIEEIRNGAQP